MSAPKATVANARRLRKAMSKPELNLWRALRRGGLDGHKFRRQHPIGRYVLDFYCAALRLAVEVDSYAHCVGSRPRRDLARDQWLLAQGVRTLRIPAHEVMASVDGTLSTISEHIAHLPPRMLRILLPRRGKKVSLPPPPGADDLRSRSGGGLTAVRAPSAAAAFPPPASAR